MNEPRKPKAEKPSKTLTICNYIIAGIRLIAIIVLVVSGPVILYLYLTLISGYELTDFQKMQLDYSITLFIGAGLILLVYTHELDSLVKRLFKLNPVTRIKENIPTQE